MYCDDLSDSNIATYITFERFDLGLWVFLTDVVADRRSPERMFAINTNIASRYLNFYNDSLS